MESLTCSKQALKQGYETEESDSKNHALYKDINILEVLNKY